MPDKEIIELLLIGSIIVLLYWLYNHKKIVLTDEEFLEFVSVERWKSRKRIRLEIEARYRGWFSCVDIYQTLDRLEKNKRIEKRVRFVKILGEVIQHYEFRKIYDTKKRTSKNKQHLFLKLEPQWSM